MTSNKNEKTKKVQSKLSFYDMLFTKTAPKVTTSSKETTDTNKNTSQNEVNNKSSSLFKDTTTTSDMEVDTTATKQQPETEAESSNTNNILINVNDDPELLPSLKQNWADTTTETFTKTGNLDEEAISPEFLKDAQQDALQHQSNIASTDKGKNPESAEVETNEIDFIRVPKITRFFATVDEDKVPGKTFQERMAKLENIFAAADGFLGVKYFRNRKQISLYFGTEYDLNKALQTNKDALPGATFNLVNSKEIRTAEADRTVHVRDIPLYAKSETLKNFFAKFGKINRFSMTTVGPWQQAFIVYEQGTPLAALNQDMWAVNIMDFSCRIALMNLPKEQRDERESFVMKLTGLPRGTTHLDLKELFAETTAKSCFIPRSRTSYKNLNYAFVAFDSDENALKAFNKNFKVKGNRLYWAVPSQQHCYVCGDPAHKSQHCSNKRTPNKTKDQYNQLYQKFKPAQYRSRAPPPRDQEFKYQNDNSYNNTRNNQRNRQNQQRFYQNQQQSRSYADMTKQRNPQNISMHEQSSPRRNNTNNNNNNTNNRPNNDKPNPNITSTHHQAPLSNEEQFNRIFYVLDQLRKDIIDIKRQTKSLQDDIDNIRMVQKEQDVRLNNLEYRIDTDYMYEDEPIDNSIEQVIDFNDIQQDQEGHGPTDTPSNNPQITKRRRVETTDPNNPYASSDAKMKDLQAKNEAIENQLNNVLNVLKQIQGSEPTQ
jgi:hypothetical protein